MTSPTEYRVVAGLQVPVALVPRIITAIRARYPAATAGIADPEAAVRAALRQWVIDTLADYEKQQALAPLAIAVAQTASSFEDKARQAKDKAITDAAAIRDGVPSDPPA